jgi:hypothetical protein
MSFTKKTPSELPLGVIALSKDQKQAYLLLRYLNNNSILVQTYHWGVELDETVCLIRQLRVLDYGFFFSPATFLVNFDLRHPAHLQPLHPIIYDNDLIRAVLVDIVRPGMQLLDKEYGEVKIVGIDWKEDRIGIQCREIGIRKYIGYITTLTSNVSKCLTMVPMLFTKKYCDMIVQRFTG